MRTSESIDQIAPALVAFQAEVENLAKEADNPFFKSKYTDLPTIMQYVRPLLAQHELAMIHGGQDTPNGINVICRIIHASGQWIETDNPIGVPDNKPQSYGSAYTYGRRYSASNALGLASEDDDGNAASAGDRAPRGRRVAATPGDFKSACDEPTQEAIKELAWDNGKCKAVWAECKQDAIAFRAAVSEALDEHLVKPEPSEDDRELF